MDFELSEELKMVQSLARDFVDEQLRPLERDILGRAADLSDARAWLPEEKEAELIRMVKEMGLWGLGVPEELGGAGLDTSGVCLVEEELARTVVPFRFGDVTPVLFECDKRQKDKYFLPALEGRKRPYLALMEPGGSPDPASLMMAAVKSDGHYIISGKKLSLSRAGEEYFGIVFAKTDGGLTCFLVDKDTPGFSVSGGGEKTGWLAQVRESLTLVFEDCRVPAENVLGEVGRAFHLGKKWLSRRRVVKGARCLGIVRRLLDEAAVHALSLETFGQPVYRRANVQAALAEIAANLHAGRLMVYEAAWKADHVKLTRNETAMVRLYTSQMVQAVADRVAHIFNGPPYVEGLPMERLCRSLLANDAVEFSLARQRHIIAGDILTMVKV